MKRFFRLLPAICLALLLPVQTASAQETEDLRFPAGGKLKIAVFADLQTTQNMPRNLTENLCAILDEERPDLVVFLGDQVEGKHPYVHIGDNEDHVRRVIDQALAPVTERGIPFAAVFGNHDAQDAGVSKEVQMAYYRTFPGCLAVDPDPDLPGCGTYHLLYYTADGSRPAVDLYFVDSLEYDDGGGYGCVSKEQIAWCRAEMESVAQSNGGEAVPAMYFQHIIVPEIYDAFQQVESKNAPGAFAGKGAGAGNWYTSELEGVEEAPCPPNYSNGQFAAWREAGNVIAAFFGHDHVNSFTAQLDGIDLTACPGASYTSYNSEAARGVRIIEIDEKTVADGTYTTRVIRFQDRNRPGLMAAVRRFFGQPHLWELELPVAAAALLIGSGVFWAALGRPGRSLGRRPNGGPRACGKKRAQLKK